MIANITPKQLRDLRTLWGVQLFFLVCMFVSMFIAPIWMVVIYVILLRSTTFFYEQMRSED